jgi:kinesin family protein 2/24
MDRIIRVNKIGLKLKKLLNIMEIERQQKVSKIEVIIRKRPLFKNELNKKYLDGIEVHNGDTIVVKEDKVRLDLKKYTQEYIFTYDKAYDETVKNETIY